MIILITGLPSSGKTTLARMVSHLFLERGIPHVWFDGKDLREIFEIHGYERENLLRFSKFVSNLSRVLSRKGFIVLISAVMPYSEMVEIVAPDMTILLECDIEKLKKRGENYERAVRGEIELPGVNVPYEKPKAVDLVLKTCEEGVEDSFEKIVEFLKMEGVIS